MDSAISHMPAGYREQEYLGSGLSAQLFRCIDGAGRSVAVKLFNQRLADPVGGADAFHAECQMAATLGAHPGVIKVLAAGISATAQPWLAMDYAPGGTLAQHIARAPGGALGLAASLDLAATLADTLAWAHRLPSPVIHGDIKPANVLLDADGRALLSDFGGAADLGSRHSVTVKQLTQIYAAPEVLKSGKASVGSDVWSLAATLFETLTGTPPFAAQAGEGLFDFIERLHRGLDDDAVPASLPEPVRALLLHGLQVDREQRTASAAAFAAEIRAAQRSLELPVTPEGPSPAPGTISSFPFVAYTEALEAATRPTVPPGQDGLRLALPRIPAQARGMARGPARGAQHRRKRLWIAAGSAAAVLLAGGGIALALSGGSGPTGAAGPSRTSGALGGDPGTAATATLSPSPLATPSDSGAATGTGSASASASPDTTSATTQAAAPAPGEISGFSVAATGVNGRALLRFNVPASHDGTSTIRCSVAGVSCGRWTYPAEGSPGATQTIGGLANGHAATIRLQDCNAANVCDMPVTRSVTTYGPLGGLAISPSVSGTVVTFKISVNPNGKAATVSVTTSKQSQTFTTGTAAWSTSLSEDVGYSTTDTITVTVTSAGRTTLSKTTSITTGPAPSPSPT